MSVDEAFSRMLASGLLVVESPEHAGLDARKRVRNPKRKRPGLDWNNITRRQYFEHPLLAECPEIAQACSGLEQRVRNLGLARNSVLFTSCRRGEGKTTAAIHLALARARYARQSQPDPPPAAGEVPGEAGGRILLLDLDFRYPAVAAALGTGAGYDLIDILQENCAPEEAIIYSEADRLFTLAARARRQEEINLLRSEAAQDLLARLHGAFDFIVIDSPSCLEVPEAVTTGADCGGVILVVQERKTRREEVANALQMLRDNHARIAGMVLNFARKAPLRG